MKRWWIVLGIVAMIVIFVVTIPARAYGMILENYGTHLLATKGTIWYGSGNLTVAGKNIGRLKWHFRPLEICTGKLAFNVTMQNQSIHLAGVLKRRISSTEFQGTTTLAHSHVNKVLLPYEILVEGEFEINDLSVKINDKRQLEVLSGSISWEGGASRYRADEETRIFEMPSVAGELTHTDGFAVLNARDQEKNIPLFTARFQPDSGLFETALTQHMLDLSQMPLDSSADLSTVVLEVSRELY